MLSRTCSTLAAAVALSVIAGCYEEVSPQQPTAQTPPAQPVESGPINDHVSQGGGSALGGAKRAATSIVDQAEQASQRTAEEIDDGTSDE